MTQIFDETGKVIPVTLVKASPMVVVQLKTKEKDGYSAVKFGFGEKNPKNINKPLKGQFKDIGNFAKLKEFKTEEVLNIGDKIDLSVFKEGDKVSVSSVSKGKGFQGPVKRYGFKGGPRSHGQKHSEREAGSLGGGGRDGGRVAKGKRMAGRMGGDLVTQKGLSVAKVSVEANEIFIKGAVSGRKGTLVFIKG